MSLPDAPAIMAAIRATWPPSGLERSGPFDLPAETRGTRRATSARLRPGATATEADIAEVERIRPGTVFGTTDDHEDALVALLRARGYGEGGISDLMAGPVAPLLGDLPPVSGFAHWPPLAVAEALWDDDGNDATRRAPMMRAPEPRVAILLRHSDRAAGALFVGIHDRIAVLHLVLTLPRFRRQGVGIIGMRHAAVWAAGQGATHLALPVEASNAAAVALYRRAGLERRGGYRYWSKT
ncbi:GNAT family N-acetyltransferase [Jannaschia aquimarina]|uniref:Acetyltransferase (GNAT) family protein n=1 Tax=Jannaschia aquimarina TaxID=935700 RepID=A0A0D1EEH3_9RHOB|nr:GNAT family N-acetyltransferase [Jannaschia aquimarina]KIT15286.1 Acetyltransferase (GNAT) family protein [Jannaschia aquimarina]SNT25338.1 Acetyltransferase (GNAT) family protein [Jannaschia aquimarina]